VLHRPETQPPRSRGPRSSFSATGATADVACGCIGEGGFYGSGARVSADGTAPRTPHACWVLRGVPSDGPLRQGDGAPRVAVLIADPHTGTRSALRNALEAANTLKIVGEAPDLLSAIKALSAGQVDIVLVDARLAGLGSESARGGLEHLSRRAQVIVMGMSDPRVYAAPLQAAGAAGYWPKDGDLAQLTGLLDAVSHRHPASQPSASRSAPTLPGSARHPAWDSQRRAPSLVLG
jgi:DNA-binding NarL/FixJ family response regulator